MTPAQSAPTASVPVPPLHDDAQVPDYVRELEQAADYLPDDQRAQLRRAWAVGAAAHVGQIGRASCRERV